MARYFYPSRYLNRLGIKIGWEMRMVNYRGLFDQTKMDGQIMVHPNLQDHTLRPYILHLSLPCSYQRPIPNLSWTKGSVIDTYRGIPNTILLTLDKINVCIDQTYCTHAHRLYKTSDANLHILYTHYFSAVFPQAPNTIYHVNILP